MSRQRTTLALLVALGAAVLLARACLGRSGDPAASPTAEPSATPSGGVGRAAGPRPPRRPDGGAGGAGAAAGPSLAFSARWGSGLGELGRDRPSEGNPEAPMSLAVDGKGRVLVLDQVNRRVVRYGPDGKPERAIGDSLRTAQDLASADDGTLAVLDRFTDKSVALYDDSGRLVGNLPLAGEGIADPGDITGVFVDDKDVYVERQHGPLVKVGDTSGNPAEARTEIPGRPSRDGLSYLSAGIVDRQAGRAFVSSIERATKQHRFTRELRLEAEILAIVLLDTDRSGTIYFGTMLSEGQDRESIQLVCLEPLRGQPIGTATLPVSAMPEETFRDLAVLDDGGVVYALRSEAGITYQTYDCQ
ncbi:MAG: hypothetical protein IT372_13500 [Polyangiaceae bacterium]|nr:hypothetical protein [Polyangiaceae bacterium]